MQKIDQRDQVWAITEYFSRDRLEKSAAALGMALSALEEDDVYHFTQRLLIEAQKFKKYPEIALLINKLKKAYYGNGELPSADKRPVPLYYLRADNQGQGEVRIRGIYIDGYLTEVLTWETWQQLKIESIQNVLELSSELIAKIEDQIDVNPKLQELLFQIKSLTNEGKEKWLHIQPVHVIKKRILDQETNIEITDDPRTRIPDSGDPSKSKFRPFQGDYFVNLQTLLSMALNTNAFIEVLLAMQKVAGYLLTPFEGRYKDKTLRVDIELEQELEAFMKLVSAYRVLVNIEQKYEMTINEQLLLYPVLRETQETIELIISKIFSISVYILGLRPKQQTQWEETELD